MSISDNLGTRMKTFYEQVPKISLVRRMPVMIRIDGKAFHTFTRGFEKPFDNTLITTMQETMKYLCENIQGCVFGYTQSDEITLVLIDYKNLESSAWFDNEVQKICSVSASMATMKFNQFFSREANYLYKHHIKNSIPLKKEIIAYLRAVDKGIFDSRCFNVPKEEVTNFVYWRQLDAIRNSIQMVGQANFSHKELENKNCNMIQDMLLSKNIDWNALPAFKQHGSACIKNSDNHWFIDKEMPVLKGINRQYLDNLIFVGE